MYRPLLQSNSKLIRTKAPARISFGTCGDKDYYIDLIGRGNGVNATIDLYSYCEIHERDDNKIVLRSLETGHVLFFDSLDEMGFNSRELNLMKAVALHYGNTGIEVITHTDIPLESGLGGSAAHAVAMIRAFDKLNKINRTNEETAKLAYHLERNVLKIEGGYQDQWASAFGGMNYMEYSKEGVKIHPIHLKDEDMETLEKNLLLVFVPREKSGQEVFFEERKRCPESVPILLMKRDNIERLKYVLENRLLGEIGKILNFDWKIKKQLASSVATDRINNIYQSAMESGATGGRLIGAGAGGAMIFYCPNSREDVLKALENFNVKELRFRFERSSDKTQQGQNLDFRALIDRKINEHRSLMKNVSESEELKEKTHLVANEIVKCYKNGGKVILFGNGGSAADAQHIAGELVGRFYYHRPMLNAIALTTNTSILTSIGNDYSFDDIFSRQIENLTERGDVVIGISTSGKSKNVLKALDLARSRGAFAVGFCGEDDSAMSEHCDVVINIPSKDTPRIQEAHITIGHIMCEIVEKELFPR